MNQTTNRGRTAFTAALASSRRSETRVRRTRVPCGPPWRLGRGMTDNSPLRLRWKRAKGPFRGWVFKGGSLAYFELYGNWLTWYDSPHPDRKKVDEVNMHTVTKVEHKLESGMVTLLCGSLPTATVYRLLPDTSSHRYMQQFAESLRDATKRERDPQSQTSEFGGFQLDGKQLTGTAVLITPKRFALGRSSKLETWVCFDATQYPDVGILRLALRSDTSTEPSEDTQCKLRVGRKAMTYKGTQPNVSFSAAASTPCRFSPISAECPSLTFFSSDGPLIESCR